MLVLSYSGTGSDSVQFATICNQIGFTVIVLSSDESRLIIRLSAAYF